MKTYRYPSAALQFAIGGTLYTLALLGVVNNGALGRVYPLILCPYALVVYGVNRILSRKERSVSFLTAINLLLFVAVILLTARIDGLGVSRWIFTTLFFALVTLSGVRLARHAAELHLLLLALDASVILLLTALTLVQATGFSLRAILPTALSVAASLSGVIVFRSGGERKAANLLSVLLILLSTALLATVLFSLTRGAGLGLLSLWRALVALLGWLLHQLERFLLFLVSLFPVSEMDTMVFPEPLPVSLPDEVTALSNEPSALVLVILALPLALGAFFLLRALRRIRLGSVRAGIPAQPTARRRVSLPDALRRFWVSCRERARLRQYLRRHRNEPYALFYRVCSLLRHTELRRDTIETPTDFLAKLASTTEDPALSDSLLALTDEVNRALFAPSSPSEIFPAAASLRRGVRRLCRKEKLRSLRARLVKRKKETSVSP